MTSQLTFFKDVTLLITHYNRSESLERLLNGFENIQVKFHDIVVSDDCSNDLHLNKLNSLKETYNFNLILGDTNKGLGNNINKGQDAVKTEYTLYIQEDFVPKPAFKEHFQDALRIMIEDKYWDLITFYSYVPYPYLRPYKNGFSEKIFRKSLLYTNNLKFYLYGDHPHLRKTNFFQKFGRYEEGLNGDRTEIEMSLSFIRNKGRGLFYDDHYGLLDQVNSTVEPSTALFRKSWTQNDAPIILALRWLYLKYKFIMLNIKLINKK